MMHSGDEFYGDEITSGRGAGDLHGLDWNEANEYTNELTGQPGEPPEEEEDDGGSSPDPSEVPQSNAGQECPPEEDDLPF